MDRAKRRTFFAGLKPGVNMEVCIYNLSIVSENLKEIKPAMLLLNIFMQKRDELNRIEVSKREISAALDIPVRTVARWLMLLAKNGLIKYKYSGSARLNPDFFYIGTAEDYEKALKEWHNFKSNIA